MEGGGYKLFIMKKLIIFLTFVLLLSSLVYADYFDDLNRILDRNNQNSGLIWNYEIIQQDDQFNIGNIVITENSTNLTIDYTLTNITKKTLKDIYVKKEKEKNKYENITDIQTDKLKKTDKDVYYGKLNILKPDKDYETIHIGNASAIINITMSFTQGVFIEDVFIYDITKDGKDYTTWFNDSTHSWYNHTKGNRLPEYKRMWVSNSTGNLGQCAISLSRDSDMQPLSFWNCISDNNRLAITYDMGRNYTFNEMLSVQQTTYRCDVILSSSNNNITWTFRYNQSIKSGGAVAASAGGPTTGYYYNKTGPFEARYVKFNFTRCNSANTVYLYSLALYDNYTSGNFPNTSYVILGNTFLDIVDAKTNELWKRLSNEAVYDIMSGVYSQDISNTIYAYDGSIYFGAGLASAANDMLKKIDFLNDSTKIFYGESRYCYQKDDATCTAWETNFSTFHHNNYYEDEGVSFSDVGYWSTENVYQTIVKNISVKSKVNYNSIKVFGNSRLSTTNFDWSNLADNSMNDNRCWLSNNLLSRVWLDFDLGSLYNVSAISLRPCSSSDTYLVTNPSILELYGSRDNITYTKISDYDIFKFPTTKRLAGYNIRFDNPQEYRWFNFSFVDSYGVAYMGLGEIEFYNKDTTEQKKVLLIGQEGHVSWRTEDVNRTQELFNNTFLGYMPLVGKYIDISQNGNIIIGNDNGLFLLDEIYSGKQSYVKKIITLSSINDVHFLTNDSFIASTSTRHIVYNFTTGEKLKNYSRNATGINIIGGSSDIMMGNSPVTPRDVYMGSKGETTGSINKIYEKIDFRLNLTNSTDFSDLNIRDIYALRTTAKQNFYWVDYVIWSTLKTVYQMNLTSIRIPDATNPIINVTFNTSSISTATNVTCNVTGYDDTNMVMNLSMKVNGVVKVSQHDIQLFNNYTFTSRYLDAGNLSTGATVSCQANISDVAGRTTTNTTTVTVLAALPGACALQSPANASTQTDSPKTLDWTNSSNANYYHIYGDNSTGQTLLKNVTDSDVSWHDLLSGQKYYWKVVAYNAGGRTNCSSNNKFEFTMAIPGMSSDQDIRLQRVYNCTINGTDCYGNWTTELLNRTKDLNATLKYINLTTRVIRASQIDNFIIKLSDFPAIVADKKYYAQLNVFDYTGNATNLTSLPTITILDALRNILVTEAEFNWTRIGVYNYTYDTSSSAVSGVWESIVTANYSNRIIVLNDYWQISSSPADVVINSMANTALPSIIANVEISNVGTADSDFYYVYCLVNTSENQCGGSDDIAYQSATRFITAGSTWTTTLTLTGTKTGTHYFKVKARALLETVWAGASKQFDITPEEGEAGPSLGSGAGGGGSTGTPYDIGKCMSDADCKEGEYCDANGFCKEKISVIEDKLEDVNRAINILLKSPFIYIVAIMFILFLITKRAYKEEEDEDNSE